MDVVRTVGFRQPIMGITKWKMTPEPRMRYMVAAVKSKSA